MENSYNNNDPLGLEAALQAKKKAKPVNDPLGLEAALVKKKEETSGGALNAGIGATSPSSSSLASSSSVDKAPEEVNPLQKVLDIYRRQQAPIKPIGAIFQQGQPPMPNDRLTQNISEAKINQIKAGDVNAIADVINKEKEILKQQKLNASDKFKSGGLGSYALAGVISNAVNPDNELSQLDKEEENVLSAGAKAISKSIAEQYSQSDKTQAERQRLGQVRREALSKIGISEQPEDGLDGNLTSDIAKVAAAKKPIKLYNPLRSINDGPQFSATDKQPQVDYGITKPSTDKPITTTPTSETYTQRLNYKNEKSLLQSVQQDLDDKIKELSTNENVKRYATTEDNELRKELIKIPEVQEAVKAAIQYKGTIDDASNLYKKYPEVKNDVERQRIIDEFARQEVQKGNTAGLFRGDRLDNEEEVKAVSEATGLDEATVRRFAENAAIPSLVGQVGRSALNVGGSSLQWVNRMLLSPGDAELQNEALQKSMYQIPEPLQAKSGNYGYQTIVRAMADGFGQFAGYAALTAGLSGGLGVAGRGLVNAAKGVDAALPGLGLNAAGEIPGIGRLLNITGDLLAPSGEGTGALASLIGKAERARELAATYAVGNASSYEQAYKEAQGFTNDIGKIEAYARDTAFLNGISELILPDIDVAKKGLALAGMKQLLRNGEVTFTRKELISAYIKKMAEITGQETLEEYIPLIGQTLDKARLFDNQTSVGEFMQQLSETTLQTTIATIPMALFGARAASTSHLTKSTLQEIAKTPETAYGMIDNLVAKGKLSEQDAADRRKLVGTVSDIVNNIPTHNLSGDKLSEAAKAEVMAHLFQQRYYQALSEGADAGVQKGYKQKIGEAQKVIDAIMGGTYQLSEGQPVESDVLENEVTAGVNPAEAPPPTAAPRPTIRSEEITADDIIGSLSETLQQPLDAQPEAADVNILTNEKTNQNAIKESQPQNQESGAESSQPQYSNTDQREQKQTQEEASLQGTDNSNSLQRSGAETQEKVGVTVQQPSGVATTQQERNGITVVQPAPRINVRLGENGNYQIINNEENTNQNEGNEVAGANVPQPGTAGNEPDVSGQSGLKRIAGTFGFGKIQSLPIADLVVSSSFRSDRPDANATQYFQKNKSKEAVLVYRHPNGKVYVLDGRSQVEAARNNRKKTIKVRFFNGTTEEAAQVAELRRNIPSRRYVQMRADRVQAQPATSFRQHALQFMLSVMRKPYGSRRGFNRSDFERAMGFGGINQNRLSPNFGRNIGISDIKNLITEKVLTNKGGINFDDFVNQWIDNEGGGRGDEQALINELGDIILQHQTKEDVINALEQESGLQGAPLVPQMLPLNVTDAEATYIAENNLTDVINNIVNNADQINLTQAEADAFERMVRDNSAQDGSIDADNLLNEIASSDDENIINLRQKLAQHGLTQYEQTPSESFGDISSENVPTQEDGFIYDQETGKWLEAAPFSKLASDTLAALTVNQAKRVANTFSKSFKGLKVSLDRNEFMAALTSALNKQKKGLGERALLLMDKLAAARSELKAAQNAFNAKRQQLDRTVQQDQVDLFGNRASETPNNLFNERIDPKAREAAIKPFSDRIKAAEKNVLDLQQKLQEALDEGPQQQAMFQLDMPPVAEIRSMNDADFLKLHPMAPVSVKIGDAQYTREGLQSAMRGLQKDIEIFGSQTAVGTATTDFKKDMRQALSNKRRADAAKAALEKLSKAYYENYGKYEASSLPASLRRNTVMYSKDGDVLGLVTDGKVFLNPDTVRIDTPMHEIGGHILAQWARTNQPELYQKMIDVAKQAPQELIDTIRQHYPNLGDSEQFWEEVFATAVGIDGRNLDRTEKIANAQGFEKIRQAIKDLYNSFVNWLIDKGLFTPQQSFNADDFRQMSLSDFSNMVGETIAAGRRLSAPSEVTNFIATGADYSLLNKEDYLYDDFGNPIDVLPQVKQEIMAEKQAIKNAAIQDGTFMTEPNGAATTLSEDAWLTVRTSRYKNRFGNNADNLLNRQSNTTFSDESNDVRYQRIGEASRLTPNQWEGLDRAKKLEESSVSANDIFLATGWFRDTGDKKWRYELPNDNVRFIVPQEGKDEYTLDEILDYPELYLAHPQLMNYKVSFHDKSEIHGIGAFNIAGKEIKVAKGLDLEEMYLTIRHEVQHGLQDILGFEQGSSHEVAERYYNRKVRLLQSQIRNLNGVLKFVSGRNTNEVSREMVDKNIEQAKEKIDALQDQYNELTNNKTYWVDHFYRNYAGEREAFGVEQRAILSDDIRAVRMPKLLPAHTAIKYEDAQANKPIFKADGTPKFDRISELKDKLSKQWQSLGNVGIVNNNVDNMRKNLDIYKTLLELGIEYAKKGVHSISDYFADRRFFELFGKETFSELPKHIRTQLTNIVRMNPRQLQIMDDAIARVINDKGDVSEAFNREMGAIRQSLDEAGRGPALSAKPRYHVNPITREWEPVVSSDDMEQRRKNYIQQMQEFSAITDGSLTHQEVQKRHLAMSTPIVLPEGFYNRETEKVALTNAAMRQLIQIGVDQFGDQYADVVREILNAPAFNEVARNALTIQLMERGVFSQDITNKIAEFDAKKNATDWSTIGNLRQREDGINSDQEELLNNSFGAEGNAITELQKNLEAARRSNDVSDVQPDFEQGISDEQAESEISDILVNKEQHEKAKEVYDNLEEAKANAEASLAMLKTTNPIEGKVTDTKKAIMEALAKKIKRIKC